LNRKQKIRELIARGWSDTKIKAYMRGWDMAGARIKARKDGAKFNDYRLTNKD